mmetsp:Transcript_11155/g.21350  ORF Transcript_11155/g.21350 Transcript_11155/m.21350 type:complete len:779 (+) Transcript_11155:313-2649(+)
MKGITKKTSFRGDESNGVNADCTLPFGKLSSFRDEMAAEVKDGSITYAHQEELPRLPIPTLEETLDKFPVFLEAIQTPKEHEETKRVTHEFKKGAGPKLQEALLEYEKEGYESGEFGSYVEEFWNEAYLSPDSSVVLNLNPFFVLEGGPDPKTASDQLRRAASLCFASVKLASMLKHETLKPDLIKGTPLCMDQFKVLFGSSRQPGSHDCDGSFDDVHVYGDSSHVLVLCKNQFYYFPALWPDTMSVAVDEADILEILQAIQRHAAETDPEVACKEAIGVLTALPRSEWSQIRAELSLSEENQKSLHVIDSALFVLVLDDFTAPDVHKAAANMLHGTQCLVDKGGSFQQMGTCLNRWYDKLQLIVCADGLSGVNFEHAAIDGHTALRFVSDVVAETIISFAESITQPIYGKGSIPHALNAVVERAALALDEMGRPMLDVVPKKLLFTIQPSIIKRISYAEAALCDQMGANDTYVLEFVEYGKQFIVRNKLSPDSVVQMSILLAYYKLYGKIVCQYEPVLTKNFYHGRTEAMRSTTVQAKKLCEIWCNGKSSSEEKVEALRVATKEHSRLVRECAGGKGVDRHLFALKCIAQKRGDPTPAFFKSDAWKTLNHTILSTSNCGNPSLRLFGFGPVVSDGFGVGYIIKDHGISYAVASKHRQTSRYVQTLETTLKEIQSVLKPFANIEVKTKLADMPPPQAATAPPAPNQFSSSYDFYGEMNPSNGKVRWGGGSRTASFNSQNSNASGSGRFFSKVTRHESLDLNEAPHIVLNLSDDESGFE